MSSIETYTKEQLDIALLKNTDEGVLRDLSEMKKHLRWTAALTFFIYVTSVIGLIYTFAKANDLL